jgi:hypothetical protein
LSLVLVADWGFCRFEKLVVFLREKPVIHFSKRCIQRIHLLCVFRHGSPPDSLAPQNVNVRVILAAYMIAYFPANVFEYMGTLEQALFDSAGPLIKNLEEIMELLSRGVLFKDIDVSVTKDLPSRLFWYLRNFKTWKVPDEQKLVLRIQNALNALYDAQKHLPEHEEPDSRLSSEFRSQIERLRAKLLAISGAETLRKFDEDRLVREPMVVSTEGQTTWTKFTNEQLAHELLMDPNFQLDDSGGMESQVAKKIRLTFHAAFWQSLADDLRLTPPCYVRVLRVLDEVRGGLVELYREPITEAIDMDLIKKRTQCNDLPWVDAFRIIESVTVIIKRAQLPKRDAETAQRFAVLHASMQGCTDCETVFCQGLEFLLERVSTMRIDAANHRLRLIAPVISENGVDYERGKLQDKINAGTITLKRTADWLRGSMDAGDSVLDKVVAGAVLNFVSKSTPFTPETCPETMLFDVDRIKLFQNEFSNIVSLVSAVVRVGHVFGKPVGDNLASMLAEKVDIHDAVYKLMSCRVCAMYRVIVSGGAPVTLPNMLRCLFPLIAQSAAKVKRIVDVNKEIHCETYAAIINEHIKKMKPSAHPRA